MGRKGVDSEVGIVVGRSLCALPESREICVWGHPATRQGRAFEGKGEPICARPLAAGPGTARSGWVGTWPESGDGGGRRGGPIAPALAGLERICPLQTLPLPQVP